MRKAENFYCANVNDHPDFSIDEWNILPSAWKSFCRVITTCVQFGFGLKPAKPCNKQCFECMAIVGQTRINTQKLINKNDSNL